MIWRSQIETMAHANAPMHVSEPLANAYVSPTDIALIQAEWLPVLFARRPRRASLLSLKPSWPLRRVTVRVHRNVASELITGVAVPYLALAGFEVEWLYGEYDDSLAFAVAGDADVELIWLDYSRFNMPDPAALIAWLVERIAQLRRRTHAPILINTDPGPSEPSAGLNSALETAAENLSGIHVCDITRIAAELGTAFFDLRNQQIAGLPYSNAAAVLMAQQLGARWLPSVLTSGLKAIVVDLDHTLYSGVLGEDGSAGLQLHEEHRELQRLLLNYREQGIFLGICSKNEPDDVWAMFEVRRDLVMRPEHLSAYAISWQRKASGILSIAKQLRIGLDAILYIDDNPGELAAIAAELPDVRVLHAGPDPQVTVRALRDYPGLHRWRTDDADQRRIADLAVATARVQEAERNSDFHAYLKSLRLRVAFRLNVRRDADRLQSLSSKTNQFNLNLRRLRASEVADYITNRDRQAVAVELADRLSDSGLIGAVFTRIVGDTCYVDEACISCRALGRSLEDLIILGAIRTGFGPGFTPSSVRFAYTSGSRNTPARRWLEGLSGEQLWEKEGVVTVNWALCSQRLVEIESLLGADAILLCK